MSIRLKRVYDRPSKQDGCRVLVDRLWPRGLRKEHAKIDLWLKDLAPSAQLRKSFGHDAGKWREFQTRYRHELGCKPEGVAELSERMRESQLTFVFAAKDRERNNAVVLKQYLEQHTEGRP
ncbi:MAG: DUF488 domain-containing protein [Nitrospiraceae bacterium]